MSKVKLFVGEIYSIGDLKVRVLNESETNYELAVYKEIEGFDKNAIHLRVGFLSFDSIDELLGMAQKSYNENLEEQNVINNPLKDLIDDETYYDLKKRNLINETGVRNYLIRERYEELKKIYKVKDVIKILADDYDYISTTTIKKIIYDGGKLKQNEDE